MCGSPLPLAVKMKRLLCSLGGHRLGPYHTHEILVHRHCWCGWSHEVDWETMTVVAQRLMPTGWRDACSGKS